MEGSKLEVAQANIAKRPKLVYYKLLLAVLPEWKIKLAKTIHEMSLKQHKAQVH